MRNLDELRVPNLQFLFTDIDDTLTDDGRLGPEAYQSLWDLQRAGCRVIPITGRPAGWCEMIARLWPVDGVVGENGGFYFRLVGQDMRRKFVFDARQIEFHRNQLNQLQKQILEAVPRAKIASDQFSRIMDLAIDFAEDVKPPLPTSEIKAIVHLFERSGATAKVSSIHVNGWFGNYDKLSMCRTLIQEEFQQDLDKINDRCVFAGDSPNDEPMFAFFQNSVGVANVRAFASDLENPPKYVTPSRGGLGFAELARKLLTPL